MFVVFFDDAAGISWAEGWRGGEVSIGGTK
jgi:hypothetical protein